MPGKGAPITAAEESRQTNSARERYLGKTGRLTQANKDYSGTPWVREEQFKALFQGQVGRHPPTKARGSCISPGDFVGE